MIDRTDIRALRDLAHRLGCDSDLVQGAGGNVSIKADGEMLIKASGAWLADADTRDILVAVALPASPDGTFTVVGENPADLRPSIETSMHAALPQAVVLHVHSVDAIALAVRKDRERQLADRLSGLRWTLVPYRRPGPPLTAALLEAVDGTAADVFILANHGLVVAAASVAAAAAVLRDVTERLKVRPREIACSAATPERRGAAAGFRPVEDPIIQTLATDPVSFQIAAGGVLYPDHAVFLGPAPMIVEPDGDVVAALARRRAQGCADPCWIIVRGRGILIAEHAPRGAEDMLRCLGDVAARIPHGAPLAFLTGDDIGALIDWDAEAYRRQMAGTGRQHDAA